MRFLPPLMLMLVLFSLVGCQQADQGVAPVTASLILIGGKILTLADGEPDSTLTAVAMADGRIVLVGSDEEVLARRGDTTEVIDLAGAVVIPGFIDSHCHLYGLGKALSEIDLVGTRSEADACARVAKAASQSRGTGWLEGRGWDQNDWPGGSYPHRDFLDAMVGRRPVLLRRVDGHAAWASSEALRLAGIRLGSPDPDGGKILRDEQGEPTGILIDNAVDLVNDIIPEPDRKELHRRVLAAIDHCLTYGITGVHEAGVSWKRLQLYKEMEQAGELKLRIYGMLDDLEDTLERGLAQGPIYTASQMLTVRAVKLYADGALGSRGALLLATYSDQQGHRGLAVTPDDHLLDVARKAGQAGFQVCTHAIGDGANRLVLDLYEEVLGELNLSDARWRIEHAQILHSDDLPRFAELGVIAAMQPAHCTSDMDWADERLGVNRLDGAYAWGALLDSGADLCFGTDFPVEHVDPLAGLYAARTRMHADGTPAGGWYPEQCLDGLTALTLYTAGSAYASFQEDLLGRVAPGFLADLTVLDTDPVACAPADLLSAEVRLTIVGGQVAYRKE